MTIKGVYTAIVTPFTTDGQVDWKAFDKLLDLQVKGGVDGVVVSGTTGETPTLTVDEKVSLFRRARAYLPSTVQVMAGTGGNDTNQSIELSKLAEAAGVNSLLVVTPPYNKPTMAGLQGHFEAIGKSVKIPLCLYHVPGRTAQKLTAEELALLCEIPQVTAVKEASADLFLFSKALIHSKATYLSGDDFTYLPSLALGGHGVISVLTNVFPKAFVELTKKYWAGDHKGALEIHNALLPLIEGLFIEANPGPTKAILHHMGHIQNTVRLPLAICSKANYDKLAKSFEHTKNQLVELGAYA
ncbi:MAG: 4-hydroxy-tetrahydrodipicolinate synthase [Proteobacteria bacterium]|nr:MAG: 4-hydroxy-tetrahydrodipicolinate synthase [Pseudomonadota bacterium]